MVAFVSSSVTPDGMLYATWSLALWLGVRILRRGPSPGQLAALAAVVGIACTVKTTSYALIPALAFVLVVCGVRARRRGVATLSRLAAAAAVPLVLTMGLWYAIARGIDRRAAGQLVDATKSGTATDWRQFGSYLWQFYLPRLPFMAHFKFTTGGLPAFQVWVKQGLGAFGWLEVRFSDGVYKGVGIVSALLGLVAAIRLWTARRRIDWVVAAYLILIAGALLAGLHWTDYHQTEAGSLGFMQGRYLFPLIGLAGCALAFALDWLPRAFRGAAAGAAVGGLLVLHILALGLTLERFYA
jgi:hypothetical protein